MEKGPSHKQPTVGSAGISIIVPAFNEVQSIQETAEQILKVMENSGIPFELIVVDDGSQDGTGDAVAGLSGVILVRHPFNRGYGAALKSGVRKSRFDAVGIIDADGTYPIDRIPFLAERFIAGQFDMVVAARTGKDVSISAFRRPAKWFLQRLANYLTDYRIPDLNSGLRIIKKAAITRFLRILPNGFSFTTTITLAMLTNDYQVDYVPVNYYPRQGRSKIRPLQDTFNFILLVIRTVMYFNPLKIFLPLSLGMFFVGGVFLALRLFVAKILISTTITMFVGGFTILAIGLLADLIDKRIG